MSPPRFTLVSIIASLPDKVLGPEHRTFHAPTRISTHSLLSPNGTDIAAAGGVIPDMIVFNRDASATGTTEGTTGGEEGTASTSDDTQLMEALRYLS